MSSRALAKRNPTDTVATALGTSAVFALAGGALGAALETPRAEGAVLGAETGLAIAALGGLVVAAVSKPNREAGLVTAGVGLGGILVLNIFSRLTQAA